MPPWLVGAVGSRLASQGKGQEPNGTRVLLYRLTYGIDDQVVALGPAPTAAASPRRQEWFDELRKDLRRW